MTASRRPTPRERRRVECSNADALFADLPPYKPATDGLLSRLPGRLVPYAQLARIHHPGYSAAYVFTWLPHTYGLLVAGTFLRTPPAQVLRTSVYLVPAVVLLVWVNRFWNDFCDADLDGQVARSRHRPLVRKAVSTQAALLSTCALAVAGAAFLIGLPTVCAIYAVPMALGCFIYPLSKRVTNLPQIVLGLVLPASVFMGAASVGATPVPFPTSFKTLLDLRSWQTPEPSGSEPMICTYLAILAWTVIFETIKSYQDAKWDKHADIGTITRVLESHASAKAFLGALAVFQTLMLSCAGMQMEATAMFWMFSVIGTFVPLMTAVVYVDLNDVAASCNYWILISGSLSGLAMLIGYTSEYYAIVMGA